MKKTERKAALYKKIDEILWYDWDPIGVNKNKTARDEYHSYLRSLLNKLIDGADIKNLSQYLDHIEQVNMGLSGNAEKNILIAEKLIQAKNELYSF